MIMALTAGILTHSHWGLSIITGQDYWTGLLEWTTGLDYRNGLLDWTTGLTFFALKIIFMAYNEIFLLVHPLNRFLTWSPASLATSCLFCISAASAIQPVQRLPVLV